MLEALGGPRERIRRAAAQIRSRPASPLNTVAIEVVAAPGARIIALAPGLADDLFEHDGQITKREIRAVTLSSLAPRRGELLWDIGAGSGSVAIEWMLADPSLRAIAIEARAERAGRIAAQCRGLRRARARGRRGPRAGGAGGTAGAGRDVRRRRRQRRGVLDAAIAALRPGGRLVVNAVTLETEAALIARHACAWRQAHPHRHRARRPVGGMTGWRPAMPVTQWGWVKP